MPALNPLRLAQAYRFLSEVYLYPVDNWTTDLPLLTPVLEDLGVAAPGVEPFTLEDLQAAHRRTFGLTGSLCYETECGLPDEFRMSQELADLAGFYRAFGFRVGGAVRERPDHVAVELEFLAVLTLKEAAARSDGTDEQVEVCRQAQRAFLEDHLGRWLALLADAIETSAPGGPYPPMARLAAELVEGHARALGARPEPALANAVRPTPLPEDLTCQGCPAGGA